jgi:hypothetical protein
MLQPEMYGFISFLEYVRTNRSCVFTQYSAWCNTVHSSVCTISRQAERTAVKSNFIMITQEHISVVLFLL